ARPAARSGPSRRTCPGRPSPAAGATGSPAWPPSALLPGPGLQRGSQGLAQRGVHEVVADVGVDRRGAIGLVTDIDLDEPAVNAIFGQMTDIRIPDLMRVLSSRDGTSATV